VNKIVQVKTLLLQLLLNFFSFNYFKDKDFLGSSITGSISGISANGLMNRVETQINKESEQQPTSINSSQTTYNSVQVLVHPNHENEAALLAENNSNKKNTSSKSLTGKRKAKLMKSQLATNHLKLIFKQIFVYQKHLLNLLRLHMML